MLGVMTNRIQIGSKMVCFCHCLVGSPHLKNSNPKNSKYLSPPHQPSICWLHHSQLYIRNMDWHNYHDPFDIFISGGFIVFSLSRLHLSCRTPGTNPYFCWKKNKSSLKKKTIKLFQSPKLHHNMWQKIIKHHQHSKLQPDPSTPRGGCFRRHRRSRTFRLSRCVAQVAKVAQPGAWQKVG